MKVYTTLYLLFSLCCATAVHAQTASQEEIAVILERHNFYRTAVGVPNIEYSEDIAKVALAWANQLKNSCTFEHSQNSLGENLFKGSVGAYTVANAIDSWAGEKKNYRYDKNRCEDGKVCGHYTQIVWKNTTKVGCAKMVCNGMVTWVCNYSPPGNFVGEKPY